MSEREQSPAGPGGPVEPSRAGTEPVGTPRDDAGYAGTAAGGTTAPQYSTSPVTVRRGDGIAGLLLILAGVAAAVSLLLSWLPGSDLTGFDLVRRGIEDLADGGVGEVIDNGFWQPLAVILGGGVLFVLGLLMILPARTHRLLGLLALLVAGAAAAGVLVPLAEAGWDTSEIDTGFWFAAAVPVLGLLGALKALLSGPKRR
jgi:hypothetical protein